MKFSDNKDDLTAMKIVLTDFGLAGKDSKGGTPIFSSPECLAKNDRKTKPDIFSLGRVMLFMLLSKENFLEFLFLPVTSATRKTLIMKEVEKHPILGCISKMMRIKNRVDLPEVKTVLKQIKTLDLCNSLRVISELIGQSMTDEMHQYVKHLQRIS